MPWTDDRVDRLKLLWRDGKSASEIARDLTDCTRNAVLSKVHRLGLMDKDKPHATRLPATNPMLKAPAAPAPKRRLVAPTFPDLAEAPPKPGIPVASDVGVPRVLAVIAMDGRGCRWPVGDPREPDFGFCDEPRADDDGAPYCARHRARSVETRQPKTPVERLAIGADNNIINQKPIP